MSKQVKSTPIEDIRNFSIIAHIDHGKSTLADRLLESTQTDLHRDKREERVLDRLELEQEKGITIKLQAVRMWWKEKQLNLIDTPGHVDFAYEVSRSLAACEAAILLVDATQGVQAQTISTTRKALDLGLKLIPVINKIDLPSANVGKREVEIEALLGFSKEEIIKVSGKTGENVEMLLDRIVNDVPPPVGDVKKPFKGLIFDSFYDEHKGVVLAVRVIDGILGHVGDAYGSQNSLPEVHLLQKKKSVKPAEIGVFAPFLEETSHLKAGEVGYIATGQKDTSFFAVGDTVSTDTSVKPLEGYQVPQPNVYATFFPIDSEKYEDLKVALNKLSLNDAALAFTDQRSNLLGAGFRCGFLGLLHMEIIQERLEREYDVELIITAPTVQYQITKIKGEEIVIKTPHELPDPSHIEEIREPWVRVQIYTPQGYMGVLMDLCGERRGEYVDTKYITQGKAAEKLDLQYITLEFDMPLASLISNFFDQMKNLTSGYASMEYEFIDYFPVDLVKVAILVNREEIPALSYLETRDNARSKAAKMLKVMKDVVPRQQFPVPLQAGIGAKIIARENVKAFRKDVTSGLYGGDFSRKKKQLEKQKKGKKRLKQVGKVKIPQEAFLAILKT
jgi:GTP-binding protein LepA